MLTTTVPTVGVLIFNTDEVAESITALAPPVAIVAFASLETIVAPAPLTVTNA